jgi:predicted Kef-type K+ transport protein
MAPGEFRPHQRLLSSIRLGVLLLTMGVSLMFALHTPLFARAGETSPPAILLGIFLLIAAGVGLLLSAGVSFVIARRLGLIEGRNRASSRDDVA